MDVILPLTEAEADTLARLMDIAVKSEGLPAAVAAVPIFNRLKEAAGKAKETHVPPGNGV